MSHLAAPAPGFLWYLAQEQTGPLVTSAIHLFNPTANATDVTLTYVLAAGGIVQRAHAVAAFSSITIESLTGRCPAAGNIVWRDCLPVGAPIVVTASTEWPGSRVSDWYEGDLTGAAPATSSGWAIADGEVGGDRNSETEIAIVNVSPSSALVRITLVFDDGTSVTRSVGVAAISQRVIDVGRLFPEAAWRRFSATVEAQNGQQLIVEHATYGSPGGVPRATGTRLLATPRP
jgi:hypothetical protein